MPKRKASSRKYANVSPDAPLSTKNNSRNSPVVPSTSCSPRAKPKSILTLMDLERKASELVKYFLIADQKKIPIRKVDINNHVLNEHKTHFTEIIERAGELLRGVFGADLFELEDKLKGRYIIVKRNHKVGSGDLLCSEDEAVKLGLLFTILAIIYMSGDLISGIELWKVLRKLGVDPDCHHEVFGDVKKLVLVEFVKQGYLECVKSTGIDLSQFHWGQRAKKELRKKDVLVHASKMYGREPTEWTALWNDCLAEDQGVGTLALTESQ